MRDFLILCVLAVSSADQLGYIYQPEVQSEDARSFSPSEMNAALLDQTFDVPLQQSPPPQSVPVTADFQKEFYSFSAPEESFDDIGASEKIASSLKKNLRVVFIRTPENKGLEDAAFNLIKQSTEDHTAIYVLSKQTDIGNLAQQLQTIKSESQRKPEVHFVKYRTPDDAINAQRAIQGQYNALTGNSRSVNGGPTTVLNFVAGSAPESAAIPVATSPKPMKAYLPPSLRRRFRL